MTAVAENPRMAARFRVTGAAPILVPLTSSAGGAARGDRIMATSEGNMR